MILARFRRGERKIQSISEASPSVGILREHLFVNPSVSHKNQKRRSNL